MMSFQWRYSSPEAWAHSDTLPSSLLSACLLSFNIVTVTFMLCAFSGSTQTVSASLKMGEQLCVLRFVFIFPITFSPTITQILAWLSVCVCVCVCVCMWGGGGNAYHLYPGKPCMCLAEYHELQSLSKLIAIYGNQLAQNKNQILFFLCHLPVNTGDAECSKNVLFWRWGQFNLTALCWTPYHAVFSTEFIDQRSQMTSHDHTPHFENNNCQYQTFVSGMSTTVSMITLSSFNLHHRHFGLDVEPKGTSLVWGGAKGHIVGLGWSQRTY